MWRMRIVHLKNGLCRLQRKHWFFTLNFWTNLYDGFGEYVLLTKEDADRIVNQFYEDQEGYKVDRYEDI